MIGSTMRTNGRGTGFGIITGAAALLAVGSAAHADADDGADTLPEILEVVGIVRDFHENSVPGGHPDFERRPDHGFGLYCGNIAPVLGTDRKPVFTGVGSKIGAQWKDAQGRPICWRLYDPRRGDDQGSQQQSDTGGIQSAESFGQWFRDVPGVNMSTPLGLVFQHQGDGTYVFDDTIDPLFAGSGGFFPIDDQLFGNSGEGGPEHNYHFTFELHMSFRYNRDIDQFFKFVGDDDVFVFVNDKLVIDLGGVHVRTEQHVDLSRLGLTDDKSYRIDFFFAERHRTESNFRIETNILLESGDIPSITAAFD